MHRSAIARWIAAALVAVVTSIIVASNLAELHARARSLGPERVVVVADRDLALGTTLRRDDLGTRKVHASQLPDGATTDLDDVVGRVVVVPLIEGSFVTPRHLAPAERDGLGAVVPAGSRAMRVDPISSPELGAGDVVDVLAVADAGGGAQAATVARAALVVRVDDPDATPHGARPGVTLLVRTSEAGRVAEAVAVAVITLTLAAPEEVAMDGGIDAGR